MSRHLESGQTDTYDFAVSTDLQVVADVADTSGTLGLLQLTPLIFCTRCPTCPPCPSTCNGSTEFPTGNSLEVSDCVGSDAGDYAIEFNIVQQSPENCGIPLSCGIAPADTTVSVPGEVDAYTFAGVAGQQISVTTTATSDTTRSLRMRLYSPQGDLQSDSCAGALTFGVPSTGTYTVLVSACVAPSTGPYTIVWQTLPACATPAAPAFAYVTYLTSSTVAVVDLATDNTVSSVPLNPASGDFGEAPIVASPNSGFVYATFANSPTVFIINTTLNRMIGSFNVPVSTSDSLTLQIALDPEGRYAYAVSQVLDGVAVIDIAARRLVAVIRADGIYGLLDKPIAVSPDGKTLYVPAVLSQTPIGNGKIHFDVGLLVIDVASRTVVGQVSDARFQSQSDFLDISFNPTATLAYVLRGDALYAVDTTTRSVTQSLLVDLTDIAYSPDGRTGYGVGCAGVVGGGCADPHAELALLVIDMPSLTIMNTIPLQEALGGRLAGAAGMALSPDGGRLLVTNPEATVEGQQPAAIVIDTATLQVVDTIAAVADGPADVAIVTPPSGLCTADDSGQTRVTVGELVSSVDYAVDGCPTAVRSHGVVSP